MQTKEMRLQRCDDDSTTVKEIAGRLCVRFEQRREDNTFDIDTILKLKGSQSQSIDYSYLRLSVNKCDRTEL